MNISTKKITKQEYDNLYNSVARILDTKVEEIKIIDNIPKIDDNEDNNKVFKGKLSVLFVDMRKSTDLTDEVKSKKMVKIYRSFIRMAIQSIRYCGGETRQFAGDGVMGLFKDDVVNGVKTTSSDKAVIAAKYIITMMDYCINPLFSKKLSGLTIACGVGICTGDVLVTKVGMRGKEQDENSENEMGLVWTGQTTNYASRYCSLAETGEIFICPKTYKELSIKEQWEKSSRTKGTKVFNGFIANKEYIELSDDIKQSPLVHYQDRTKGSFIQEIFAETQVKSMVLIDEISNKSMELSKQLEDVKKQKAEISKQEDRLYDLEDTLDSKERSLNQKEGELNRKSNKLLWDEYNLYKKLFRDTYLKNDLVQLIGKDFWMKQIALMFELGTKIGKSRTDVQSDLDCYLVNIYTCFDMPYEAYDALCIQAEYSSWLNETFSISVVMNAKYYTSLNSRFRSILEKRRWENDDYNNVLKKMNELRIGL